MATLQKEINIAKIQCMTNRTTCEVAKKHIGNEPAMIKITTMLELLYGNLKSCHYAIPSQGLCKPVI